MPLDYFHTAQILGNLLTLPQQFEEQRRQSEMQRAILGQIQDAGGPSFTPAQMQEIAPSAPPSGLGVPVLGQVLRGVGTIGQVLQGVLGTAPPAPRPPLAELSVLNQLQQRNKRQAARMKVAEGLREGVQPNELRARAIEAGVAPGTLGIQSPQKPFTGERATLAAALNVPLDNPSPEQVQQVEMSYDQMIRGRNASMAGAAAGARQEATLPTSPTAAITLSAFRRRGLTPATASPEQLDEINSEIIANVTRLKGAGKQDAVTTSSQGAIAILEDARQAVSHLRQRGILSDSMAEAKLGPTAAKLYWYAEQGDPDAVAVTQLMNVVPRFARGLGEVRPNVLEESRLRNALNFHSKTGSAAQQIIEHYLKIFSDVQKNPSVLQNPAYDVQTEQGTTAIVPGAQGEAGAAEPGGGQKQIRLKSGKVITVE